MATFNPVTTNDLLQGDNNLNKTTEAFKKLVEPELIRAVGGRFILVEGSDNNIAKALDLIGGIDLLHLKNLSLRGVGSRIQFGETCWETFTIRKDRESGEKTEYDKRKQAIEKGWIYPQYTLQAYVTDYALLGFAFAKTEHIFKMIEYGACDIRETNSNRIGQSSFYVIKWRTMRETDCDITYETF